MKTPTWIKKKIQDLKNPYTPLRDQIPIKLVSMMVIFPFAGFVYLAFYLGMFGIGYESLYFNVNDCITILYEKGMLFFLIAILLVGSSLPLISTLIDFFRQDEKKEKVKNWHVLSILILAWGAIIFIFYTFKVVPQKGIILLSVLLLFAILIYLFKSRIEGVVMGIIFLSLFTSLYSVTDAEKRKNDKPKFDIVIKNDNKFLKILSETDSCRYFIRKTSDYIFIMDDCKNKVMIYPISDLKSISFTPK